MTEPTLEAMLAALSWADDTACGLPNDVPPWDAYDAAFSWLSANLARLLDAEADRQRMDFIESGGWSAWRSSVREYANVIDCRDDTLGENFSGKSVREAIDLARAARSPEGEPNV